MINSKKFILTDDIDYNHICNDDLLKLNNKLNKLRDKIDKIDTKIWKKMRWFVNDYDFKKDSVIINRAYYKYLEIIITFQLYNDRYPENILHLAEAPGGFIQVSLNIDKHKINKYKKMKVIDEDGFEKYIKVNNINIFTMSIMNEYDKFIFDETILKRNVNVIKGYLERGDLLDYENINILKSLSKYDIITSDGGFDDNHDYNKKEEQHLNLIKAEIEYGIECCNENGHFIVKIFDMFNENTFELIGKLYSHFKNVIIYKPYTSRPTNSEKYVICKYKRIRPNEYNKKKLFSMLYNINHIFVENQCDILSKSLECCTDEFYDYICKNEREIGLYKQSFYKKWKSKFTCEAISYNNKTETYS